MSDTRSPKLLWLDLESTGSETSDSIIEVGCVLTDRSLQEIGSFTSLVRPDLPNWTRMFSLQPVVDMHQQNGLIDDIEAGFSHGYLPPCHSVEAAVIDWAVRLGAKPGATYLAGSGVSHFDQRMLLAHMPLLARFCRYATIDIGVIRRVHSIMLEELPSRANDAKTHRALDDVYCHIQEMRDYLDFFQA